MNNADNSRKTNQAGSIMRCLAILAFIGCCFGCASREAVRQSPSVAFNGEKIVVLPMINMAQLYGIHQSVKSPFSNKYHVIGTIKEGSDRFLTERLLSFLHGRSNLMFLQPDMNQDELSVLALIKKKPTGVKHLIEIGKNMDADAIIAGAVYSFKQRVGTKHSVDSPASVAFEIHLIDTRDASILWSGYYNETQQALSENLFKMNTFFKRRGVWITAEEMAVTGLEELLKTFPN